MQQTLLHFCQQIGQNKAHAYSHLCWRPTFQPSCHCGPAPAVSCRCLGLALERAPHFVNPPQRQITIITKTSESNPRTHVTNFGTRLSDVDRFQRASLSLSFLFSPLMPLRPCSSWAQNSGVYLFSPLEILNSLERSWVRLLRPFAKGVVCIASEPAWRSFCVHFFFRRPALQRSVSRTYLYSSIETLLCTRTNRSILIWNTPY